MGLYAELRRRNVFRVAAAYIVMGWLLLQVADVAFGFIDAPDWVPKALLTFLVIGFPPAIAIAWIFEFTPQGLKRDGDSGDGRGENQVAARRLDYLTIGAVLILAAWTFYEQVRPPATTTAGTGARTPSQAASTAASRPEADTTPASEAPVPRQPRLEPPPLELDPLAVAVLPFANRSPDGDEGYFVDGIHDDLLTQLARIGELRVISRTSVSEYRDTSKNMKQIGEELNARNIVEGSVQRAGNRVRINAQLIDANTDKHLWADTFDRELTADNLFDIQSDIARSIARALASTISDADLDELTTSEAPTSSQEAYDLYLRARALGSQVSVEAPYERIALLEQAIAIDPEFALAVAEIGFQYTNLYWFKTKDPADEQRGHEWLERARALDPDDPQIQWYWADHLYHGHLDYEGALVELAKAEAQLPNVADLYRLRGWIQRRAGEFEAAIESYEQVVRLDPRDAGIMLDLAITHAGLDDHERYGLWRDRMLATGLDPDTFLSYAQSEWYFAGNLDALREATSDDYESAAFEHFWRFLIAWVDRDWDDALAIVEGWPADLLFNQHRLGVRGLARALVARARGDEATMREQAALALDTIDTFLAEFPEDPRGIVTRALILALLGRSDEAIVEADRAVAIYPRSLDGFGHSEYLRHRVRVLAVTSSSIELAQALEELVQTPGNGHGVDSLLATPLFDAHRDHPAFELLAAKYNGTSTP